MKLPSDKTWQGKTYAERKRMDKFAQIWPRENWQGWNGGECPVHCDREVEVRFRDGSTTEGPADCLWWRADRDKPRSNDIVAYRVLPDCNPQGAA